MELCTYGEIFIAILIEHKKLSHLKVSKSGQILCVDKTGFPSPVTIVKTLLILQSCCNTFIQFVSDLQTLYSQGSCLQIRYKSHGCVVTIT